MKLTTASDVLLFLIVLITVSCGPVTPIPPATLTPTGTPIFRSSPTASPTPSPTVAPSSTPFLPSSWEYSPPAFGPSAYKLKPWTEGDYAFFINSMNEGELFHSYPTSLPAFDSFFGYEYLLHANEIKASDDLVWKIAQMDPEGIPLPGMRNGEQLFNFLVEKMLNEEKISIDQLGTALESHGFSVTNTISVKNFYGKGDDAFFFEAFDNNGYRNLSAILAIRRVNGIYQVDTIKDWEWMFGGGSGRDYSFEDVVDTNANGFPELVVEDSEGHSGFPHFEKSIIWLYEWDGQNKNHRSNSFVIFRQFCDDGACEGKWEIQNTDPNSFPAIVIQEYWNTQTECPHLTSQSTYRWDGKGYPLLQNAILPSISERAECMIAWAEARIRLQNYGWQNDRAIQIISDALNQWPAAMDRDWGPASRDYFRLRLGIWKDLRGESEDALKLLEPLATTPFIADYSLPSQAAIAYLNQRNTNGLINACQNANETWSLAIKKGIPDPFIDPEIDIVRNFLGFASDLWGYTTYDFSSVCSENDAIFAASQNLTNNLPANPANWFTRAGRSVYMAKQEDFNRDGMKDWLVIAQTSKNGQFSSAWFFFADSNGFDAYEFDERFDNFRPSLWRVIHPDEESDAIYLDHIGKSIWIFRANSNKQIETLVDDYSVSLLQINQNKGLRIKVLEERSDYKGTKIKNYVWEAPSQTFVTFIEEYDFEGARQNVERMIFQEHDYASAISLIQRFFAESPTEYLQTSSCTGNECVYDPEIYYPGMYYLMGVAYEMLEQPEKAARAYYFLWRDYPDSPYALLAQYKLEPISP